MALVIIRKDMLAQANAGLTSMLSYKTHADSNSLYNTCPTFTIYIVIRFCIGSRTTAVLLVSKK